MAESSEKISTSKHPFHFLFRCFGSSPKVQNKKNPANGRRDRRLLSIRFRFKKSSATVPVDAAGPSDDEAYYSPEFKKPPPLPPRKSRIPVVRAEIIETIKPVQTRKKTDSTRSDSTAERFPPAKLATALLHSIAAVKPESSYRRKPAHTPPEKKFDSVIIVVSVAILILWGRVCATLCTAALFYFSRRLRSEVGLGGGERRVLNPRLNK